MSNNSFYSNPIQSLSLSYSTSLDDNTSSLTPIIHIPSSHSNHLELSVSVPYNFLPLLNEQTNAPCIHVSTSSGIFPNTHNMLTRSKTGITKPHFFAFTIHGMPILP